LNATTARLNDAFWHVAVPGQTSAAIIRHQMGLGAIASATSASTACAARARDPLRRTSVGGSATSPGWRKVIILFLSIAYHSSSGYVADFHRH
jgi:hypothetical protein